MSAPESIVVAMSGGVDSSAAALLLHEQGHRVIGVSMQVWDYRRSGGSGSRATCCAPADFEDARQVAAKAGFPFYVFDFEDSFHAAVIEPFVRSYQRGLTPNPCLDCNRRVKFQELRRRAETLGASKIATGHYARIERQDNGRLRLLTGSDGAKDQSYFLYALTQEDLRQSVFPVGLMTKADVRKLLAERGLSMAEKSESQDICFVSGAVSEFVERELRRSGDAMKPGVFVDASGQVLGTHSGVHNFTVGQRRGLGIGGDRNPLYVLSIDDESAAVTVGEKRELERSGFCVHDLHWIAGEPPELDQPLLAKLRYRHPGVLCRVADIAGEEARLEFTDQWTAVSPGQAAVFYSLETLEDGAREVLGGGIIGK